MENFGGGDSTAPDGMKVIIIGPSASGKTAIANYLAGQTVRFF